MLRKWNGYYMAFKHSLNAIVLINTIGFTFAVNAVYTSFGNICTSAGDGASEGEQMVVEVVGGDGAFGFEDEPGGFGGGKGF